MAYQLSYLFMNITILKIFFHTSFIFHQGSSSCMFAFVSRPVVLEAFPKCVLSFGCLHMVKNKRKPLSTVACKLDWRVMWLRLPLDIRCWYQNLTSFICGFYLFQISLKGEDLMTIILGARFFSREWEGVWEEGCLLTSGMFKFI